MYLNYMKYFVGLLCVLCFVRLPAQNAHTQLQKVQDSLRQLKVDTFLVYTIECLGSGYIDTCNPVAQYLFWRKGGKSFVKKFNQCHTYQAWQIIENDPLIFSISNKANILKEKIKTPVYFIHGDGSMGDEVSAFTDHDCYDDVTVITGTAITNKRVSEYYLNFKKFGNGRMNVNYQYNQNTALKALIDKLNLSVHKLYPQ